MDGSGNVYVTGVCDAGEYWRDGDYTTIKYYPSGDTAWVRTYNGPADTSDHACAVALDDSGNIYVTGYSHSVGTGLDYLTIKYNPDGDTVWVRRYDGPENTNDVANAIAVGGSGNAYVTGRPAAIEYYPNGDTAWVRVHGGPEGYLTESFRVEVDDSGCVYVIGLFVVDGTGQDYCTAKYYPDGDTAWVRRYNGPANCDDMANALALDESGNVYVTGRSDMEGGWEYDYTTIRYVQALRGDANGDGAVEAGDAVYLIDYLFRNGFAPNPLAAGDCSCDGEVGPGDVVYLINYLFKGWPPPSC